ncbi:MAG: hypothetical protein ACTMIH_07550 [Microbacterium gubbeenense]|uniref:hypothetical protein n=1 Tax=Microbacterium gubbeenense TaxID=159896 RepID=UPI00042338E4|nr:hypothetical protein [Microbacterium gubbeenense]
MDDIEEMLRDARPESGRRDRAPSARSERELDALILSTQAEQIPGRARVVRKRRGIGRRTIRTALILLAGAIAIAVAGGLASLLDGAQQEPPPVAQPAEPDPSTVLSSAADKLDGTGEQSESGIAAPEDSRALIEWLTSGELTRSNQATWLRDLSEDGLATHAERGADDTWLVDVAGVTLVIREAAGEVSAVIDTQGRTHTVPPGT